MHRKLFLENTLRRHWRPGDFRRHWHVTCIRGQASEPIGSPSTKLARGVSDEYRPSGYLALTARHATMVVARQRPQFFCARAGKLHFFREFAALLNPETLR